MRAAARRAGAVLALAAAAGCAHVEAPRGGPDVREPLVLAAVQPDSLQVVPGLRGPVVFEFGARLSERGLDDAVMVSPRTSSVVVSHRGRQLRVSLRGGWEPGQIYQVTVTPTIQDLWSNRLEQRLTHVFSTGPAIPETRLVGEALDRITGRPEVDIRVEAIRGADSLVYATRTDSAGAFVFTHIPEGDYRVRAFRDVNRNRELDPFEARDTADARVTTADTAAARLSVVTPDTTPPQVASARLAQGLLEVLFDDHLDPAQPLDPAQVQVSDSLGTPVPVRRLAVGSLEAEPAEGEEGEGEETTPPAAPAAPTAGVQPGVTPAGQRLPSQTLVVQLDGELAPATEYRVVVQGVRNVVGLVGGGEATFTTPAAPAQPDPEEGPPDLEEAPPPAEPEESEEPEEPPLPPGR